MLPTSAIMYLLPYLVSLVLSTGVGWYAWQRRSRVGAFPFAVVAFGGSLWTLGAIFENVSTSLNAKVFWDLAQWLPGTIQTIAFLVFAVQFTQLNLPAAKWLWRVLAFYIAIFFLITITDPLHHWVISNPYLVSGKPFSALLYKFPPLIYFHSIILYIVLFSALFILIAYFFRVPRIYRLQILAIIVGMVVPMIGGLWTVFELPTIFPQRDITPITFGLANVIFAWGLFRFRLFDIVPIARNFLVEEMQDGIIVINNQHQIVDLNPAMEKILEIPKNRAIGMSDEQAFAKWPRFVARYQNVDSLQEELETGSPDNIQYFDLNISPIHNYSGQSVGRLIVLRNITDRKIAQNELERYRENLEQLVETRTAELRQSEERYRLISTVSSDYVFSTQVMEDGTLDLDWVAGAFEKITGYTREEYIAHGGWLAALYPDDLAIDRRDFARLQANEPVISEVRTITKSGDLRWVRVYAHPVWNESSNHLQGILGAVQIIDEQKRAEEALRASEEKYRELSISLEKHVEERTAQLQESNQLLNNEKIRLQSYNRQREYLGEMTALLQASNSVDEAGRIISAHIGKLFPEWSGGLYFINASSSVEPITVWGNEAINLDHLFATSDCWALRRGKTYLVGENIPHPLCLHVKKEAFERPANSLCIPLSAQGENIGILHLIVSEKLDETALKDGELLFLETIADSVALSLANIRLRESLHEQSIRDSLTGLFNHRHMADSLTREVRKAERSHAPLSVMMLEIDGFRVYNNTYGHEAGNYVLTQLGNTLKANLRSSDFPCRYGGDEFTLILPGTTLSDAGKLGEQIRSAVETMKLHYEGKTLGKITVSVGVAGFPRHGETGEAVFKAADAASYRAKDAGKNCVRIAE
jgi:diguanylate cyclase (GGDEF)-like protein/PAS domain S-box-containing protein